MILCGLVLMIVGLVWIWKRRTLSEGQKRILGVVVAAALLGGAAGIAGSRNTALLEGNLLARRENGEGSYEMELKLYEEGDKEEVLYLVEVPEQRLTVEEERAYLAAAREEMEREFPGSNASINHIGERVEIRDSYQDGKVEAEWNFDNYKIMDYEGNVIAEELPEEGTLVRARVTFCCGTSSSMEEFYFQVFPNVPDERTAFRQQLEKTIAAQGEKRGEEYLKLPDAVGNHALKWEEKRDYTPEKILIFGGVLAAFIPLVERSRQQEQIKKRNRLLEIEYPDLVSKMALLLSSGMTLQGAWKKIALSYGEKRKNDAVAEMPAYEEMLTACREMESGIGEQRAYERFGERCSQARYRRFSNILAQNLRKGSQGIVVLLEQEAENAFEERKSAAKRYGEEAGTKLLFPMMIMLGIVMFILVIPAVFTFQI